MFCNSIVLFMLQANCGLAQQLTDREAALPGVETEAARGDAVFGMPIDTGWIVLDGEFVEPPYVVAKQGADLFINDQRVMTLDQAIGGGREGFRRGDGRGEGRSEAARNEHHQGNQQQRNRRRDAMGAARIERQLTQGGMVVIVTDVGSASLSRNRLPKFVEAIESDQPIEAKVLALNGIAERPVHSAVWLYTIENYRPNAPLSEIAAEVQEEIDQRTLAREREAAGNSWLNWMLPMAAIGAVLLGVGVLLQAHRVGLKEPGEYRVWRHVDTSGLRSRMVLILIGLLLLLNGLDLAFTLIAQQTGQFAELSPIGDRLITRPILLGLYKVAAVALGAGLLLYLRHRRAAEVAAWWMCAVYVLVLVRWVAVNTLIMA